MQVEKNNLLHHCVHYMKVSFILYCEKQWGGIQLLYMAIRSIKTQTPIWGKRSHTKNVQLLVNASDRGLINCIHAALFFTKDIPAHITPNNAELACLDLQNTTRKNMQFSLGSGVMGRPDPEFSVSINGIDVHNENKSPGLSRRSASISGESDRFTHRHLVHLQIGKCN